MAAHDSNQKGPFIPIGLTPEEKAHHLENLSVDLRLSPEELDEYRRARFDTTEWFNRSINQFTRLGNTEKVEELVKRKEAFEARPQPLVAENPNIHSDDHGSYGALHFSPQYLDHDERYKRIVEERVATWNKEHPNEPLPTNVLTEREDGSRIIHEEIIKAIPAIEEEADKSFAAKYSDDYTRYKVNEKSRIYKDNSGNPLPENDPAYKKMMREINERIEKANLEREQLIQSKTDAEYNRRKDKVDENAKSTYAFSARRIDRDEIEAQIRNSTDPLEVIDGKTRREVLFAFILQSPLKAEEYAKKDPLLQQALREYKEEQAHVHAQKDVARQVAEGIRKSGIPVMEELSEEELEQVTPEKVELVSIPSDESGMNEGVEYTKGSDNGNTQPDQASSYQQRRRFSPGGFLQNANRVASGARNAVQVTGRVVSWLMKVPPWVWPVAAAVILIILVIVVIATVIGGGGERTELAETPVSITKEGPDSVNNGENIPYKIKVSYPGTASNIIITDNIPEGAEFVSASGVHNCNPSPCDQNTTTVTWEANKQAVTSGTPTPSVGPSPSSLRTIHNLGFGPSDPARIDNLVSTLSPGSPLIGQGKWVIDRAREFNLDPLMIIIFKNESQFCNDTGVVSPAGSDPDNFNCGGILWPAAQQEADIDRWHAQSGPVAYTHVFTFVPSIQDGTGLFFDYSSASFYQGKTIQQFYDIYNPCSDSAQYQLACGAPEANRMMQLLEDTLGPACSSGPDCYTGGGGGSYFPPMEFTLTVKPVITNAYIINQASAQVVK